MAIENPEVEARFYSVGENSPYVTLRNEVITSISLSRRAEVARDQVEMTLDDRGGILAAPADRLVSGDRVELAVDIGDGGGFQRTFTGLVREPGRTVTAPDGQYRVSLSPTDFVFSILSFRLAFNAFEEESIGGIMKALIEQEAPEIGTSRIADFTGVTTDLFADGRRLDDAVRRLVNESNAYVASDGRDLVVERPTTLAPPTTLSGPEHGLVSVKERDAELVNRVRIDGGEARRIDEQQPDVSSFATVDESTREVALLNTTKGELAAVQVATDRRTDGGRLRVRIQKASGGVPVAPGDRTADIVSRSLGPEFLATGGDFTTFLLGENNLPNTNVALLVEASGGKQDVGVDANGKLAFKSEFPFPLSVRERDQTSIETHRRRDTRIRRDNIDSTAAARGVAASELRGRTAPRLEVTFEAQRPPATGLGPLDPLELTDSATPAIARERELVVIERREEYRNNRLTIQLTCRATDQF